MIQQSLLFLAAYVLLAPAFIANAQENEEQRRAAEEIKKLRDEWVLSDIDDEGAVLGVDLSYSKKVSDNDLVLLQPFKKLQILRLDNTRITDKGLEKIRDLKELRILELRDTQVTDKGLKSLGNLSHLRSLALMRTKITDNGLEALENFKDLEELDR
jgi:hypothetical protein